jgi:para-aminobenzoate synthetase component I
MQTIVQEIKCEHSPEALARALLGHPGLVLLRSGLFDAGHARYSFLAVCPFLTLRAYGSRCELVNNSGTQILYGNPWSILETLIARFELLDEFDFPFPLGGCFGYWGYELKNFVEPKLRQRAVNDLELPDLHLGFYDSLLVFDHHLNRTWVVATGLRGDGNRTALGSEEAIEFWNHAVAHTESPSSHPSASTGSVESNLSREEFICKVVTAQKYIRSGDIYQVNLSHRLQAATDLSGWDLFSELSNVSPAPHAAFLDANNFQVVSSSPELFMRLSGGHIITRPIKGTRPRSPDPLRDAQLTYELQTSAKEISELVMITDLLRNDLGRVCEFGSVQVPDLLRLEKYSQVQHLVSTVEGRLRAGITHSAALASCFPGGSVTGAPKIRAMEIIDELEPITRGPYTGCLGYLGFNRESQLSIVIRTAVCKDGCAYFSTGAGIVADSDPEAEYEETLAKAQGFLAATKSQPLINEQPRASAVAARPSNSNPSPRRTPKSSV